MKGKINNLTVLIEKRVLREANFFIEKNSTVRETAKMEGTSKSTVHKDLTERLQEINYLKYILVHDILKTNKKERSMRGGMATKKKYLNIKK